MQTPKKITVKNNGLTGAELKRRGEAKKRLGNEMKANGESMKRIGDATKENYLRKKADASKMKTGGIKGKKK